MIERHNMTDALFTQSDLHQKVLDACRAALVAEQCFRKDEIMKTVRDVFLIDAVRWDWIVKKLKADKSFPGGGVDLIPVAESFFKANAMEKAAMKADYPAGEDPTQYKHHPAFPGKWTATGFGKRTAGWVMATYADGRFALYKAELAMKNVNGRAKQNRELGAAVTRQLISQGNTAKVAEIAKVTGIPVPKMIAKRVP
jgi:hypothetical protein